MKNRIIKPQIGQINFLARPLGIEVEFSKIPQVMFKGIQKYDCWHWENDGTLTAGGKELVVDPASGDVYLKQLVMLMKYINTYQPEVDASCGFHVHVQAGDLSWWELRRVIAIWCKIEGEVFKKFVNPKRRDNRFCLPMLVTPDEKREAWQFEPVNINAMMRGRINNTHKIKRWLLKKLYHIDIGVGEAACAPKYSAEQFSKLTLEQQTAYTKEQSKQRRFIEAIRRFDASKEHKRTNGGHGGCRYCAMNMHSYFHRGTIEFRLKEGTLDYEELIYWPVFCGWVVESAVRFSDNVVRSISGLESWLMVAEFVQPSVREWVRRRLQ